MSSDSTNLQRQYNNTLERSATKRRKSLRDLTRKISKKSSTRSSDLSKKNEINPKAPIHKFRRGRQAQGRDTKIIITSRNSTTGTGKTTLAVWLALNWDQHGFDVSKATLPLQTITWPDISDHEVKLQLDAKKKKKNEQQNERAKKEEEAVDPAKVKKQTRDELIKAFYEHNGMTQKDVADCVNISTRRVRQILNEE